MAIQLRVIKNQKGTTWQEQIIQGQWQHWTSKTRDKDENERIKRRYQTQCARRASGITFIWYAQNRKIAKPSKCFGAIKPKCLNRIAKIGYRHTKQQLQIKPQQRKLKIRYDHRQQCDHINRYLRKTNASLTLPCNNMYVVIIGVLN